MFNKINQFLDNLVTSVGTWVLNVLLIVIFLLSIFVPELFKSTLHLTDNGVGNAQVVLAVAFMVIMAFMAISWFRKQG